MSYDLCAIAVDLDAVRAALATNVPSKVKDKEAVASIEQVRSWLDTCATSNRDLVCTYA